MGQRGVDELDRVHRDTDQIGGRTLGHPHDGRNAPEAREVAVRVSLLGALRRIVLKVGEYLVAAEAVVHGSFREGDAAV